VDSDNLDFAKNGLGGIAPFIVQTGWRENRISSLYTMTVTNSGRPSANKVLILDIISCII